MMMYDENWTPTNKYEEEDEAAHRSIEHDDINADFKSKSTVKREEK